MEPREMTAPPEWKRIRERRTPSRLGVTRCRIGGKTAASVTVMAMIRQGDLVGARDADCERRNASSIWVMFSTHDRIVDHRGRYQWDQAEA